MSDTVPTTDLQERIERLERQVEAERNARREAEAAAAESHRIRVAQEQRAELLRAITAAANAADSADEVMGDALELICRHTGWPVGHVYRRRGERLVPTQLWCGDSEEAKRFVGWCDLTHASSFQRGEGVPGRVLETERAVWTSDVAGLEGDARAASALEHGLHAAIAVPVRVHGEVAAVFEFYALDPEAPDDGLLEMLSYAGVQVGHVIERQRLERRHALILGAAGEGIYGLDTEGRTLFANPATVEMTGWTAEELLGQRQHERLHHAHADGSPYPLEACPITHVLRDGRERRVTGEVFWRRDGTSFPVAYVATPIREGDAVTGVVVVFHDVSEREELQALQAAERALHASEARYRALIDAAPDVVLVYPLGPDGPGPFAEVNDAAVRLYGYDRARLAEMTVADLVVPGSIDVPDAVEQLRREGEGRFQTVHRTADGREVPMETVSHLFDLDGQPTVVSLCRDISERRAAEVAVHRALRHAEAAERRKAEILESIGDAFFALDPEWRFTYVNEQAEPLLQRAPADLVGKNVWEEFPEAVGSPFWDHYHQAVESGRAVTFDADYPPLEAHLSVRAYPYPGGLSVYFSDITAQKRAEALLRESEAQLLALVDNLPELAWSAQPDGRIDFYNRRWYEYTGTTFEEMEGWGWEALHHPDALPEVRARWQHSIETGEPFEMAFPLRGADGEYRWFLTRVRPLRDTDGRITRWIGINTDIDEQKRLLAERDAALADAEASEGRYRFLTESLLQQIWTAEPDGALDYVNPYILDYFGRSAEEMIGQGWQDVVHPDDLPAVVASWRHSLATGKPYEVEFRLRRATDDAYRWHLGRASALRDAEGRVVKWFGTNTDIHERKEAEAALEEANRLLERRVEARTAELRASQDLLHSVTAHALDGIVALEAVRDDDGRIVDFRWLLVNPPAAAMYGHPAESLIGALQNEVLPEVAETGLHDALVEVVESGESFRQEIESEEVPGQWFNLSVSKLDDGIVALFRDITESKSAEAALRASEAQLQAAQKLAHVGSWRWDIATDEVTWSDELFRIFGFSPGEIDVDYERYAACLHPDDRESVGRTVQDAVARGEGYELNHRVVRPDGTVRWIHSFGEVIPDADGQVAALQGTAQDVTERVEAERALQSYAARLEQAQTGLRASTDFLQRTLDSLTAHVAILDAAGNILAVNEAWRRFAGENGYEGGHCGLGENYLDACDAPEGESIASDIGTGIQRLLDGEVDHYTAEYPCHSPTEKRWFLLRVTRFDGPDGIRLVTAHENVTEMKQAQAELQRYARELEESNEELAKFAYVASHDLQEPLRMVTSFLQLLERRYEGQLDDTAREYIDYAVDGARRMQRLIQDLLAYSRVGTRGKAFEAVASGEALLDVLHDLGPAIHDAGAEVVHDALPTVYADPTQLHQLLLNLVGNALKFRREGEAPRIRITAAPEALEEGQPGWRFSIADNGIGVEEQYAERIFQVFQRLHTREEYEGTGIGLAICKKIVERHGGAIAVTSGPGPGSTFSFTLPAPPPAAPPPPSTS